MRALLDDLFEADSRLFLFRHKLIEGDRIVAKHFDRAGHFSDLIASACGNRDVAATADDGTHCSRQGGQTRDDVAADIKPSDQHRADQAQDHRNHKDPGAEAQDREGLGIRVRNVLRCGDRQTSHLCRQTFREFPVFTQQLRPLDNGDNFAPTQSRNAIVANRERS